MRRMTVCGLAKPILITLLLRTFLLPLVLPDAVQLSAGSAALYEVLLLTDSVRRHSISTACEAAIKSTISVANALIILIWGEK